MKARIWLMALLLAAVILAGCQSGAPTPAATEAPVAATEAPAESYPAPEQAGENAQPAAEEPYPGPSLLAAAQEDTGSIYPDPKSGDEILWHQAESLLLNGEVTQVIQEADLKVTLMLADGRSLWSAQPAEDTVLQVIETCGEPCANIETGP
jgi:hypothetical protein